MCPKKPKMETDSDSESDISMSSNSETHEEEYQSLSSSESDDQMNEGTQNENVEEYINEDEEDDLVRAIRRECDKKPEHPPAIKCHDFISCLSFHPCEDLLAVANVLGDVEYYKYSLETNDSVRSVELHMKSCRAIEFSADGQQLYTTSKDKSIVLSSVETGQLVRFYDAAHEAGVYSLVVIDTNLFATGDDDGIVKMWDLRRAEAKPVYRVKKNNDYISAMVVDEEKYLLCASGDGSLTTIDYPNRKFVMQTEEYEEELTSLGIFRSGTKLISGTSKGNLLLFNWNEFGLHSDLFPSNKKNAINAMVPITENIVVTACEDGHLRATHLFPHRHLGVVGQHKMSVENLDISHNGRYLASSSHENDVKFWNVEYFEDLSKVDTKHKKHMKRKEMANNLPSSSNQNASDFFSELN